MRKPTPVTLTLSAPASLDPANPFPSPVAEPVPTTRATCGPPQWSASASYDPVTRCWKMSQGFLLQDISEPSWETWPKAGMTHAGAFYQQPSWERRISEIGSGLLPTPRAHKMYPERHANIIRGRIYRLSGQDYAPSLPTLFGGVVNPEFQEWMMGWPLGWSAILPLPTDKFLQWLRQHGIS